MPTWFGWLATPIRLAGHAISSIRAHGSTKLQIADLIDEVVRLRDENRQLRARVQEFEAQAACGPELVFRAPVYWAADPEAPNPGPFCTKSLL